MYGGLLIRHIYVVRQTGRQEDLKGPLPLLLYA